MKKWDASLVTILKMASDERKDTEEFTSQFDVDSGALAFSGGMEEIEDQIGCFHDASLCFERMGREITRVCEYL